MANRRGLIVAVVAGLVLAVACSRSDQPAIPDCAYHQARHAMEQGRWDWARVYLEEDLNVNPDRHQSVRDLAIAWISGYGGGLSQGVEYFERYLETEPDDQEALRRLVETLIRLERYEQGRLWAQGLDDQPGAYYLKAYLAADVNPSVALDHLKATLDADPRHAGAWALVARIRENRGETALAEEACRRSLGLDPFNAKVRARLERSLKKQGRHEEVQDQLRALEIVGRLNQSVGAAVLSSVEELRLLRELESVTSASGFVFSRRLAKTLLRSGSFKEGSALIEEIEDDPRFLVGDRLSFAKVMGTIGKNQQAGRLYEEVLALDPLNVTARASLAHLACAAGGHREARSRMEKALATDPWVAVFHAALAHALLLEGEEDVAVRHWETALVLAPWEKTWRQRLAQILTARGEGDRAEAVLAAGPKMEESGLPGDPGPFGNTGVEGMPQTGKTTSVDGPGWWADVSAEVGLDFVQYDGRSGRRYYVETTASGCGFLDFDDDGDLDVYLLTGAQTPGSVPVKTPRNRLYENREGRFIDVSERAGVGDQGFGMGMCVGDVDGDGLLDFLVTNYGPDRLYRNLGLGRFEEIAHQAGVDDPRWSSNCAFGDIDDDGDLDLYVTHYLDAGFENNPFCGDRARNISAYCRPSVFPGVSDSLFINSGDGRFTEEGGRRGLLRGELEKGFGVVLTDLDDDRDLDIFVANDSTPNRLYLNDGKGFFEEIGLLSGLGLNGEGMPTSGMGVDIGDVDGDLRQDVVLTNYAMESNNLYRNLGNGVFEDVSGATGISGASRPEVGWGARLADFDNDGDLDLAIANGHVVDNITLFEPESSYGQQNRLLLNDGTGAFQDVSSGAGAPWSAARVSRALTIGDWNDDGRLDLLIANTNDRFELLENRIENGHHWLGVKLVGRDGNSAAIGARVVATAGNRVMMREVRSGTGFQSQGDLRLHFGLGEYPGEVTLDIVWPDGSRQVESVDDLNRYCVIKQRP